MCGVALLFGDTAEKTILPVLARLSHRGPDDQHRWFHEKLAIGFVRLAINDEKMSGRQPYQTDGMIGAFNGEIYNADFLVKRFSLKLESYCDTHVIAPLFDRLGLRLLEELDGFYSGIIYRTDRQKLYLFRDHIGKKPLFYGRANNNLFVVSELKAIENIEWFKQVSLGISQLDLITGELTHLVQHQLPAKLLTSNFNTVMESAVVKRMPTQPFGVFLSGGLDSSIIAALVNKYRKDVTYFVLGNPDNEDVLMVKTLVEYLGLKKVRYVPLPHDQKLPELISNVVYTTESFNPSIISNGLATYLLAEAANKEGFKVVLSGEGADELFGGYHEYSSEQEWAVKRSRLISDMRYTELRRLDTCCMAHSLEARCPYLDRDVKNIADNLDHTSFFYASRNKVALRNTFVSLLPTIIIERKKTSFDVGSGIRQIVVNYLTRNGNNEIDELRKIWKKMLWHKDSKSTYFFAYPAFDAVIAKRGVAHG